MAQDGGSGLGHENTVSQALQYLHSFFSLPSLLYNFSSPSRILWSQRLTQNQANSSFSELLQIRAETSHIISYSRAVAISPVQVVFHKKKRNKLQISSSQILEKTRSKIERF